MCFVNLANIRGIKVNICQDLFGNLLVHAQRQCGGLDEEHLKLVN